MSRGLGTAALLLSLLLVLPGDAQQRPAIGPISSHQIQFKLIDTQASSIANSKLFRNSKPSSPFSLSRFFPKISLPLLSSKPVRTPIAAPGQNPLVPHKGATVVNQSTR